MRSDYLSASLDSNIRAPGQPRARNERKTAQLRSIPLRRKRSSKRLPLTFVARIGNIYIPIAWYPLST